MKTYEEELLELIQPLFVDFGYEVQKATKKQIEIFDAIAVENELPEKVKTELKRFYRVTNGIACLEVDIKKVQDTLIYEFWKSQRKLWLGQRDMDMISWKEGKFHLGTAVNLNYGKYYIFETLLDLLKKGFKDWNIGTN